MAQAAILAAEAEDASSRITMFPVRPRASGTQSQFLNFLVGGHSYILPTSKFLQLPGLFHSNNSISSNGHIEKLLVYGSSDPVFKACIIDLENRLRQYIERYYTQLRLPARSVELIENGGEWFKSLYSREYDSIFLQFSALCQHFQDSPGTAPVLCTFPAGPLNIKLLVTFSSLTISNEGTLRVFSRVTQTLMRPYEPICLISGENMAGIPALSSISPLAIDFSPDIDQVAAENSVVDDDTMLGAPPKKKGRNPPHPSTSST